MRAIEKPAVMQFTSGEKMMIAQVITAAVSPAASIGEIATAVQFALDDALVAVDDYRERNKANRERPEDHPVMLNVIRNTSWNGPAS